MEVFCRDSAQYNMAVCSLRRSEPLLSERAQRKQNWRLHEMRRSGTRRMRSPLRMLLLLIALVVATYEYIEKPSKNTSSAVPPTQASTGCGGAKNCEQGRVTRVIDGDTL